MTCGGSACPPLLLACLRLSPSLPPSLALFLPRAVCVCVCVCVCCTVCVLTKVGQCMHASTGCMLCVAPRFNTETRLVQQAAVAGTCC